jgi:hypothetical protein
MLLPVLVASIDQGPFDLRSAFNLANHHGGSDHVSGALPSVT